MKTSFLRFFPESRIFLKKVAMILASLTILAEIGIIEIIGDWCIKKGWSTSIMLHFFFPIISITVDVAILIATFIFIDPLPALPSAALPSHTPEPPQDLPKSSLNDPNALADLPETLGLVSKGTDRFYQCLKSDQYKATSDDFIVLTTDALARWIFLQKEHEPSRCLKLINCIDKSESELTEFVYSERNKGALEEDDTTMLVISLGSQDSTRQGGIRE